MDSELWLRMSKKIAQLTKVTHPYIFQSKLLLPRTSNNGTTTTPGCGTHPVLRAQVIYHLNKRNEDLEFDVQDLAAQHEADLDSVQKQAQDRHAALATQLEEQQEAASSRLEATVQVCCHHVMQDKAHDTQRASTRTTTKRSPNHNRQHHTASCILPSTGAASRA